MENYLTPTYIENHSIYDVFYSPENMIVIIVAAFKGPVDIRLIKGSDTSRFSVISDPYQHIYTHPSTDYSRQIKISIDGVESDLSVNRYVDCSGQIIMSTLVKNQNSYIIQWIEYNRDRGIERFIIYDNSANHTLGVLLADYVATGSVILIKWAYPYWLPKGPSSPGAQVTQQNHSIYAFRDARYIGLMDVDEYLNPQGSHSDLSALFNDLSKTLDTAEISAFQIRNRFFYNPDKLPCDGYRFLEIYTCDEFTTNGREKCFVLPKKVIRFDVHRIKVGKPMHKVNVSLLYFNHYCYLNNDRKLGLTRTELTDKSVTIHADRLLTRLNRS